MKDGSIQRETFGGTYPFAPNYRHVNGFDMHFVDEGKGEPVVLLHGDPTWGYLWRNIIPGLAKTARCVVPDHMGMGKSEVPRAPYPYRLVHPLIVWGMLDPVLPGSVLRWWKDVFPQATVHEIGDASHFLQEDAPERIGGYISEFMAANP